MKMSQIVVWQIKIMWYYQFDLFNASREIFRFMYKILDATLLLINI